MTESNSQNKGRTNDFVCRRNFGRDHDCGIDWLCLVVDSRQKEKGSLQVNLMHGDCLELMKSIPDKSIDLVLTDPPYGTTACKWDSIIPFEPMWKELKRIRKDNAAICLFGSEPFSSALRMSNIKEFKYDWYWNKNATSGFVNAKLKPMSTMETISIFSSGKT